MADNPFETVVMQTFMRDTANKLRVDVAEIPQFRIIDEDRLPDFFRIPAPDVVEIPKSLFSELSKNEESLKSLVAFNIARHAFSGEEINAAADATEAARNAALLSASTAVIGAMGTGIAVGGRKIQATITKTQDRELATRRDFLRGALAAAGTIAAVHSGLVILGSNASHNLLAQERAFGAYGHNGKYVSLDGGEQGRQRYQDMWDTVETWTSNTKLPDTQDLKDFKNALNMLSANAPDMLPKSAPLQR